MKSFICFVIFVSSFIFSVTHAATEENTTLAIVRVTNSLGMSYILGTSHFHELGSVPDEVSSVDAYLYEHDSSVDVDFEKLSIYFSLKEEDRKNFELFKEKVEGLKESPYVTILQYFTSTLKEVNPEALMALALLGSISAEYDGKTDDQLDKRFEDKERCPMMTSDMLWESFESLNAFPILSAVFMKEGLGVEDSLAEDSERKGELLGKLLGKFTDLRLAYLDLFIHVLYSRFLRNRIFAEKIKAAFSEGKTVCAAMGANHLICNFGVINNLMHSYPDATFELWKGGEIWETIGYATPWVRCGISDIIDPTVHGVVRDILDKKPLSTEYVESIASQVIEARRARK